MDRQRTKPGAILALALLGLLAGGGSAVPAANGEELVELGPVTNLPLPRFVSIRAGEANARRGPGLDYRVDWAFVQRGLPVEVTAEHGQWRRVRDADGLGGWVHQSLLSGARTVLVQGAETVPLRARPEAGATLRALVEPGALARLEACDGQWCRIDADGYDGWVAREALWGVRPGEDFD